MNHGQKFKHHFEMLISNVSPQNICSMINHFDPTRSVLKETRSMKVMMCVQFSQGGGNNKLSVGP